MNQILLYALAAVPFICVFLLLLVLRRIDEFPFGTIFLGLLGIVIAFGSGIISLFAVINYFPQTNSTLSDSFLIGVFAVIMAVACIVGEFFRYMVLKTSQKEERPALSGLAYGVGMALGEYIFFIAMSVMNVDYKIGLDMVLMLLVDIIIQIGISFVAFELIKQDNIAFAPVGGMYYLSLFLLMALNGSTVLNIVAKAVVLIITGALTIVFWPSKRVTE